MTGSHTRSCAATKCRERVELGHLMCREHWFSVPKALRDTIWLTFRARITERYRDAVNKAVDLIDDREFGRGPDDARTVQDGAFVQYVGHRL